MPALQTMLSPDVLTKVVSQKAAASDWLLQVFGLQSGGPNEVFEGHARTGQYHIYNNVRSVGRGKAPGAPAAESAPNIMGAVAFTYPRLFDSVPLPAETLHNLGLISNPGVRDQMGADMIKRQTVTLGQKAANWRKAQLIGALRDSLYIRLEGDGYYFTFTSTSAMQVPFGMPAGNKTQLNMTGAGNIITATWANAGTDIPLHLGNINAAFQYLNGGHLAVVICGFGVWNYIKRNDAVQEEHGTSHSPFLRFERLAVEQTIAKTSKNVFVAELASAPGVLFYITDEGLDIGPPGAEVFTKIVEDNKAIFVGFEPGDDVLTCYQGSEPISEYDGAPREVKIGMASWSVDMANPTVTKLFVLDNALIVNHVPDSIAYGTVVF